MAEIYKIPKGTYSRGRDRLNYVVAHHVETQAELEIKASALAAKAESILAAHRDTGASQITHERGKVDHYVVLTDDHAISIEYDHQGRKAPSPLRRALKARS